MIALSPRSYVTEAFDTFFPVLTEYIYRTLSNKRPDDWWKTYILRWQKEEDSRLKNRHIEFPSLPTEGNLDTLRKCFDEYKLFKLVKYQDIQKLFSNPPEIEELFKQLSILRNEWAHRRKKSRKWATIAINSMIEFSEITREPVKTTKKLINIRIAMLNIKPLRCLRKGLIDFLEKEIFAVIERSMDEEAKRIVQVTRKELEKTESAEEVVFFFGMLFVNSTNRANTLRKKVFLLLRISVLTSILCATDDNYTVSV